MTERSTSFAKRKSRRGEDCETGAYRRREKRSLAVWVMNYPQALTAWEDRD